MLIAVLHMKSPFFDLYHQAPDYKFLKTFGRACYPHLRPYNYHKFAYHSRECVFLGHSSNHKGYKCLSSDGILFISKDVIFNEVRFPYNNIFSSPKHSSLSTSIIISVHLSFSNLSTHLSHTSPLYPRTSPNSTSPRLSPITLTPFISSSHQSPTSNNSHSPNLYQPLIPSVSVSLDNHTSQLVSQTESSQSYLNTSPSSFSSSLPYIAPPPLLRIHPHNTNYMTTRDKDGIVLPCLHPTLLLTKLEPTSYKLALKYSN